MKKRTAHKSALGLAISMVLTYPLALQALGLGELHSSSQLNQPLNAQIDLLSTNTKEAGQLQVRLASADVFSRVGIDRPAFLNSLKFVPAIKNGKPIIRVTSSAPISEPFLNFLLEVSWPQGQLLKEYTVLLDPPVLMNAGSASTENAAAVRAEPKPQVVSGVVNRGQEADRQRAQQQRQRQLQVQRQQEARQAKTSSRQQQEFEAQALAVLNEDDKATGRAITRSSSSSTKYRVKRGDTMNRIASRLRYRGVSNNQMMVALFRANPQAFSNDNINYLKSGALLSKPPKSQVLQNSSAESRQIVKQHYAQWKKYRASLASKTVPQSTVPNASTTGRSVAQGATPSSDKANLSVVGSSDKTADSNQVSAAGTVELQKKLTLAQEALASSQSESAELRSRVTQLEAIIRKKERLITLKNDKLARLESQLGTTLATAKADGDSKQSAVVNESEDLVQQVANQADQNNNRIIRGNEGVAGETAQQPTTSGNVVKQTAINTTPDESTGKAVNEVAESDPFVTDDGADSNGGILDLLSSPLVAAIGGGGLLALLFGWLLMRRSSSTLDVEDDLDDMNDVEDEGDFFEDDSETTIDSEFDESADDHEITGESNVNTSDVDAFDSILSGDDTFEEDEILQEADVYIVYGLHEQAEDELKKAIANKPDKLEYRYKLLENYKAAGDPESFVSTAKDFLNAEGNNKQQLWDKIVVWGKEVAPENNLFAESSVSKAVGIIAGGAATLGAATQVAKEAFSPDSDSEDVTGALSPDLDSTEDLNISGLDNGDFNLDLTDELSEDIDLDDNFGLDELAGEIDSSAFDSDNNILDFGSPVSSDSKDETDITSLDLEVDQDSGLDKLLPKGNGYTPNDASDDNLDDALSFLDLSDDDEEVQQAHIGTKLDLARAYLDMGDVEGARHTLEEVVIEGNDDQKREAEELLQQTG